jgi:hypothetical protein
MLAACGGGTDAAQTVTTKGSVLAHASVQPVGTQCAAGGARIDAGVDSNGNGVLDPAEITGTRYVCNGTLGATGVAGQNGLTVLMRLDVEAAGANCAVGGTQVSAGLDINADNVHDSGEITRTQYTCNGAPGAGVTWVDVTGTSQQAVSGVGYLANNAAQVTVTLPSTPAIGDLIEVSGVGAGGWRIAQNGSQSIVTKALPADQLNFGAAWTAHDSVRNWYSVASSSDGSKLVAVAENGSIYTSTNNRTTAGSAGSLTGSQYDAIRLQYIGGNLWMPLRATSYSGRFTVN